MRKFPTISLVTISWIILAQACGLDNTEDVIADRNSPPLIDILARGDNHGNHLLDTTKTSGLAGQFPLKFSIKVQDVNANLNSIPLDNFPIAEAFSIQFDSLLVDAEVLEVNQEADSMIIKFEMIFTEPGDFQIYFRVKDDFNNLNGSSVDATVEVHVFDNWTPVLNWDIATSEVYTWVREFDLSDSFDLDQKYGGKINSYLFFIDQHRYEIAISNLQFGFPKPGEYPIRLGVKDNNRDSTISEIIIIRIEE